MSSRFLLSVFAVAALLAGVAYSVAPMAWAQDAAKPAATAAVVAPTKPATPAAVAAVPAIATQEGFLMSESQKDAIRELVGEYIRKHPQDIIDAVESHAAKQAKEEGATDSTLGTPPDGLYNYALTPFIGAKDGDVTIVQFFDYNCGFCKRAAADVLRVSKEDSKVKILFKELPILSDSSELAARWALAANKQGKYIEMHEKLMAHSGAIDESVLETYAKDLSLDVEKLKKEAQSQDTTDSLNSNIELARTMSIRGTPFFVIGNQKVPGAVGYTRIKELVEQARTAAPATKAE
jgi:protein-disulfide isomerase